MRRDVLIKPENEKEKCKPADESLDKDIIFQRLTSGIEYASIEESKEIFAALDALSSESLEIAEIKTFTI